MSRKACATTSKRSWRELMQPEHITIKQTATGYWTVQRGAVHVAGSMTRRGAEAERDLLLRLSRRTIRRAGRRAGAKASAPVRP
jgi:hypothetical protein